MEITQIAPDYWISPQLTVADVAQAKEQGYTAIVCNRPDGEQAGQPTSDDIRAACKQAGLRFANLPMQGPNYTPAMVQELKDLLAKEDKVLGYCRTGNRSSVLYRATQEA